MYHLRAFFFGMLLLSNSAFTQVPEKKSSSDIYSAIQKLNFLGTALYVAAHPDDENTRLISYLSNEVKARTGYLSITRGDGGQNLIGTELKELLGVIRTQELLGARRVDGGEQFFTRAIDFGFSKHPDETLRIWNKAEILDDIVAVIRAFKPDVIINRFDHASPGSTHGHHTASAMLSLEAFDLVNDPKSYPEQLSTVTLWQPRRIFFNTSWWFYGSEENFEKADKSNMLSLNVGAYYPLLGVSNNEIAALASSQHLSQGFGRLSNRGNENDYIQLLKGDLPVDKSNIFDGINTTWSRIEGGEDIGKILYTIEKNFDFANPSKHIPQLVEAYKLIQKLSDTHWRVQKTKELEEIISATSGLYLEATAEEGYSSPGGTIKIDIEAINRSSQDLVLKSVDVSNSKSKLYPDETLLPNQGRNYEFTVDIPLQTSYTSPYWLTNQGSLGMYEVKNRALIGKPETPRALIAHFVINIGGHDIPIQKPVVYRFAKPDKGELYHSFEVLPKASARISEKVLIFSNIESKQIPVEIKALENNLKGTASIKIPANWNVYPEKIDFEIAQKGDVSTVYFTLSPPKMESEGKIIPVVTSDGQEYTQELVEINYEHIPKQSVLIPSETKVVRLNIVKAGEHIGYIVGAGDKVPESLEQIGYKVNTITLSEIQEESLKQYDAIVVGIRAYNVVDQLKYKQRFLLDYVKNGGNLIIQYNTSGRRGLDFENLAPYEIHVSSDRVTDENSPVEILDQSHSLVNFPNKLNKKDFNGWVQERGLYFPDTWGKEFTPILAMQDPEESLKKGSLLVASYGKGNYIYTGLSFFRQLPEGVPGAYKLFTNMISLGKEQDIRATSKR